MRIVPFSPFSGSGGGQRQVSIGSFADLAALNTFAADNTNLLFNDDEQVSIATVDSNTTYRWSLGNNLNPYNADGWTIASQPASDFSAVEDGRVVLVRNGQAVNAPMMVDENGNLLFLVTPNAGSGSYDLGPLTFSNSFGFATFTNAANGETFHAIDHAVPTDGPSRKPRRLHMPAGQVPLPVFTDDTQSLSFPRTFQFTTSELARTNVLMLEAETPIVNARFRITNISPDIAGVTILEWPDQGAWITGRGGQNFDAGFMPLDLTDARLPFSGGRTVEVEVRADSGTLRGGADGIPKLSVMYQPAEFITLADLGDISHAFNHSNHSGLTAKITEDDSGLPIVTLTVTGGGGGGGGASNATQLSVTGSDTPNFAPDATNQRLVNVAFDTQFKVVAEQIDTLASASSSSGRAIVPVPANNSFSIDNTNLAEFNDRIVIYAPQNDKVINIELPSDAEILATTGYPVYFEPLHVGGTVESGSGTNLMRWYVNGGNPSLIADNIAVIQKDQTGLIGKASETDDWTFTRLPFGDPSTLVASGTFQIQKGSSVDVSKLNELVNVQSGQAFFVGVGGQGVTTDDLILALINDPSDDVTSEDWFVLREFDESTLFLEHVTRDGNRFDLDKNVFANPSNVIIETNTATVNTNNLIIFTPNSQNVETDILGTATTEFSELVGGSLTLEYSITGSSSGFEPELRELKFDYGDGIVFTFNILNRGLSGLESITINIPNADYSSILNKSCTVSLTYIERGFQFVGSLTVFSLINTNVGTLHQPIVDLVNGIVDPQVARINSSITGLQNKDQALSARIDQVAQIGNNPILQLDAAKASLLLNDVSVDEETTPTQVATPLNLLLGGGSVAGAILQTNQVINKAEPSRQGKKLYYFDTTADGDKLLRANNVDLLERSGNDINVKQLVAATASGSRTVEHYPSPSNRVGGDNRWFLMVLEIGHVTPVATSLPLVNDLPTTPTNVTVYTEILANGHDYDIQSHNLVVGGGDAQVSFVEVQGSESVSVTVKYRANERDILIEAEPHIANGGLAIDDLQVRAEWTSQEVIAGVPAHVQDVYFGSAGDTPLLAAVSIIDGNIHITGRQGEINTGYTATSLLGSVLSGFYVTTANAVYDLNFTPNQANMITLNSNSAGDLYGLYTTSYSENTFLDFDTQVRVKDSANNQQNVLSLVNDVDVDGVITAMKAVIVYEGNGNFSISIDEADK